MTYSICNKLKTFCIREKMFFSSILNPAENYKIKKSVKKLLLFLFRIKRFFLIPKGF